MGYFNIAKYKIFYSDDRFIEINKPFYKTLSAHEKIGMKVLDINGKLDKNAVKLEKLQIEKLKEDFEKLQRQDFIEKWVELDFMKERAQIVSWEIIYDYFDIHKNGIIKDLREFDTKLIDDYTGKGYLFPQGEVLVLEFKLYRNKNIIARLFDKGGALRTMVNLTRIQRIKGTLNNLEIQTDSQVLKLSDNVEIINKNDN